MSQGFTIIIFLLIWSHQAYAQPNLMFIEKVAKDYILEYQSKNNSNLNCAKGLSISYWSKYPVLLLRSYDPYNESPQRDDPILRPVRSDTIYELKNNESFTDDGEVKITYTMSPDYFTYRTFRKDSLSSSFKLIKHESLSLDNSSKLLTVEHADSHSISKRCVYRENI